MDAKLSKHLMDYVTNFDAEYYRKMVTHGKEACTADHSEFISAFERMHHEIFAALEPCERLLDVGSGPTVWNAMSASAKYKDITLSDPLPQNRRLLEQYMTDKSGSQDEWYTEHYKLTAKLEGDVEKWQDVRDRVRASIQRVLWCDVLQEQALGPEHHAEPYDCVTSSLCLEVACEDVATYKQAVKNLASPAKPGAPVVMSGVLEESWYKVGEHTFPTVPVTTDTVRHALLDADCAVHKMLFHQMPCNTLYVAQAQKR